MTMYHSNSITKTILLTPEKEKDVPKTQEKNETKGFQRQLIWINLISIVGLHILGIYSFRHFLNMKILTILYATLLGIIGGFGVTGGAHRFWTHRTFKANLPLRIILMYCFTMSGQNTMYDWVRDHRVHHKFSETDADPHNATRGFWFAHVGWLTQRKHPEVLRRGKEIDMSDILEDPVVQFHQKHFTFLKLFFCFFIPIMTPYYLWNETLYFSFLSMVSRYIFILNSTWFVNSAAHIWGAKPYDKDIFPAENKFVSIMALGEGWHNYHHVFPWDYKAAEIPYYINLTTMVIDLFAKIGWAYDLKQASPSLIKRVAERNGDGSHTLWEEVPESENLKNE